MWLEYICMFCYMTYMYIPHSPITSGGPFLSDAPGPCSSPLLAHEDPALEVRWRVGWSGGCKGLLLVPVAWISSRHRFRWINGYFRRNWLIHLVEFPIPTTYQWPSLWDMWVWLKHNINGHFRNRLIGGTNPIYKAYFSGLNFREYPHNIWPYMVQYLQFRILNFPLKERWNGGWSDVVTM